MWKIWTLVFFVAAAGTLSGCNTLHGAGEDIEKAGEEVQDAVD